MVDDATILKILEAKTAFCSMPLHDFLKTDHANHLWVWRGNEQWSRGQPSKVPYEVTKSTTQHDAAGLAYWRHYGYDRMTPRIRAVVK